MTRHLMPTSGLCRRLAAGACVLAGLAASSVFAAPPKLTGIFPNGAPRGQSVTVTASGDFSAWPVDVWVDRPGVTIVAESDKGKFKATVAADAQPGVYWLRVSNAEGASVLRPFVVGTLPEIEEVEPNDAPNKPQVLKEPAVIHGRLAKAGDVDMFALRLRQGEQLAVALEGNVPFGSPMDATLQIVWLSGAAYDAETPIVATSPTNSRRLDAFVLEQDDDAAGLDPRLAFVAPRDGWYAIRTFAFPSETNATVAFAGGDAYVYRLTVSTSGLVEHGWPLAAGVGTTTPMRFGGWNLPATAQQERAISAPPLDPAQVGLFGFVDVSLDGVPGVARLKLVDGASVIAADTSDPAAPQAVPIPVTISGRIEVPRDVDAFSFMAMKDAKIRISVEARSLGFPLDPVLFVTDAAGKQLAENDDAGKGRDAELVFTPPADGEFRVLVRDVHRHGGPRYVYRLSLTAAVPDFALTLAADSFVLAAGKTVEIPVTVERRDGLDQPIECSVLGLPPGVTAATVISEPKGDSAKGVKLVLTADAAAKFTQRGVPIRVIGRVAATPARFRLATFVTGPGQVSHQDIWITLPAM